MKLLAISMEDVLRCLSLNYSFLILFEGAYLRFSLIISYLQFS
jgi:hypothetical protein